MAGRDDRRLLMAGVWCGPLFALLFAIGFIMAGFLPPPKAHDSAAEITRMYVDHRDAIRIGTVLMMTATLFIAPWGVAMASQTRRTETGFPALTAIQLVCCGVVVFTIVLFDLIWAVAAFRAGQIPEETTRTLNDIGFFLLIFDWPPFCLWVLSFAIAGFRDHSAAPIFPRWSAYLNLWIVFLSIPGVMIVFFKTGPLAFHGFVAFYFPVVVFFIWLVAMTYLTIKAINSQETA
jgi:hypothetical protein